MPSIWRNWGVRQRHQGHSPSLEPFPSWTALRRKRVTDPLCLQDRERRQLEKLARPGRALQNLGSDRLG